MGLKVEQLESRVDGKMSSLKEQVSGLSLQVTETGLGVKQILQKLESTDGASASQRAPWQPQQGWNGSSNSSQSYGRDGKGGGGKGGGKGSSYGGGKGGKGGWQGGRSVRRCWKCGSLEHLMAACDKAIGDSATVLSVQDALTWYGDGGTQSFSSWDLVNQFAPAEALEWDYSNGCYWVEPVVESMGYELVGVEFLGAGGHGTLRVYVDRDSGVSLDDCAAISHQVSGMRKVYQEIRLQDLSASEAQDMVESLLMTKTIPSDFPIVGMRGASAMNHR